MTFSTPHLASLCALFPFNPKITNNQINDHYSNYARVLTLLLPLQNVINPHVKLVAPIILNPAHNAIYLPNKKSLSLSFIAHSKILLIP